MRISAREKKLYFILICFYCLQLLFLERLLRRTRDRCRLNDAHARRIIFIVVHRIGRSFALMRYYYVCLFFSRFSYNSTRVNSCVAELFIGPTPLSCDFILLPLSVRRE